MIFPFRDSPRRRQGRASPRVFSTFALTFAVAIAIPFCGGNPPPGLSPLTDRARLYYSDSGGIADSARIVVRDVEEWRRVWDQATARQDDPPPLPAVDFEQNMVVLVAAGRSTPGDRIRVDSAGVVQQPTTGGGTERVLRIVVRTVRTCGDFQGESFPVEIVRVRRYEGSVSFVERTRQGPGCRQSRADRVSPASSPSGSRAAERADAETRSNPTRSNPREGP